MNINLHQSPNIRPLRPTGPKTAEEQLTAARELKSAYTDFVGKTFFGQMLKAMRSTLDKPAYFHGGQTEEVFRNQLDQHLADRMTEVSADQIANPMFRLQFPRQAAMIAEADKQAAASMTDLSSLRRR